MAKSPYPDITQDPRYPDFVARFHADPMRFAVEVTGFAPSGDQEDLFHAITPMDAKVSVVSGTGTGKTSSYGRIALWHLLCFPFAVYEGKVEVGSNTYIGAPLIQQVADGVWKEMQDTRVAIAATEFAWVNDYYTISKTRVHVHGFSDQWFIAQVAMKKGEAIGVAGKHRYWQLIIIDEAAGVSDDHFNVIKGTQTQPGNRTLMASQGARNAGYFYDSHHTLRKENGGEWTALCFNSERSPFVTKEWLKAREEESGGRNSVEYRIRVLGQFAENSSNVLLTRADMEKVFEVGSIIGPDEPYGLLILSDVALGEYRDDSVITVAKVIGDGDHGPDARRVEIDQIPLASNDKNEIDLTGDLINLHGQLSNPTLMVDAGGVGATVCKLIERASVPVVKINWGVPCFRKEYKTRFYNQRACAQVRMRDAIRSGRFSITARVDKRLREKIITQGSRLPYHFSEAGGLRYVMDSKEDMRKEGIKSPDVMDTMSFPFLESATYMPADLEGMAANSIGAQVASTVASMFANA